MPRHNSFPFGITAMELCEWLPHGDRAVECDGHNRDIGSNGNGKGTLWNGWIFWSALVSISSPFWKEQVAPLSKI